MTENILRFIEDLGYSDVCLQSDSEGAIKNLIKTGYCEQGQEDQWRDPHARCSTLLAPEQRRSLAHGPNYP